MSDHCGYSARKTEINVKNHHIPAYIFNLKNETSKEIDKLSSQIDIFPTLFGYLGWSYNTSLYGKDINRMTPKEERAFIGNHRKVGLLKKENLCYLKQISNIYFMIGIKKKTKLLQYKPILYF
ncbi:hypothetical protein [Tenacibaculum pelagium]|uniref:hypothetical protein n=1 Tax=Tenacibaculum pelagium TaxID=2759527 RepID=UPI001FE72C7D|nr:hypothetical protein [Tenacibaculum pelagium]